MLTYELVYHDLGNQVHLRTLYQKGLTDFDLYHHRSSLQ